MKVFPVISNAEQTMQRHEVALLGEETGGALIFRSQDVEPGQGTPLHKHLEQDETFHIIEGEFRFVVGEQAIIVSEGTTLFVPRNTPHSLLNIGDSKTKIISALTPGIHDGFVLNVPIAEKAGASNSELSEMAGNFGAVILGPKQHFKRT